jgi:hypothetical protein
VEEEAAAQERPGAGSLLVIYVWGVQGRVRGAQAGGAALGFLGVSGVRVQGITFLYEDCREGKVGHWGGGGGVPAQGLRGCFEFKVRFRVSGFTM